jgi:hypothetical protein
MFAPSGPMSQDNLFSEMYDNLEQIVSLVNAGKLEAGL